MKNILDHSYEELKRYYNGELNSNLSHFVSSNDEPTPIECVEEMLSHIPFEFWGRNDLRVLDPCAGNGNFHLAGLQYLIRAGHELKDVLEQIFTFNEVNPTRVNFIHNIFRSDVFNLQVTTQDFLSFETNPLFGDSYDLIYLNPPYARMTKEGKRASKNHTLVRDFLKRAIEVCNPGGYVVAVVPDNWMSFADRNDLITMMTERQFRWIDIHGAKRYFPKIGSSFTMFVLQNQRTRDSFPVVSHYKKSVISSNVQSRPRRFIPLLMSAEVDNILLKTIESDHPKYEVQTSSDLHRFTKSSLIVDERDELHPHKLIHTPSKTVWSSRPHKFQDGYKVFISTTDKYGTFVDDCGMTQSIAFIQCGSKEEAMRIAEILKHPLYVFLNNICRWGNFNNIRVLQRLPKCDDFDPFEFFGLDDEERNLVQKFT
jgi:hypothetical protein